MTIPSVRATALINDESTGSANPHSGTLPASIQDGDVGIMVVVQGTGANTVSVTGWTALEGPTAVDSNCTAYVLGKDLTAADASAAIDVTWSGSGFGCGVVAVIQDADSLAEVVSSVTAQAAGGTAPTVSAVTTGEADCGVLQMVVGRVATGTALSFTAPASHTLADQANTAHSVSPNFAAAVAYLTAGAPTAGAYGSSGSWTASASTTGAVSFAVALTPAPAAGPVPSLNVYVVDDSGVKQPCDVYTVLAGAGTPTVVANDFEDGADGVEVPLDNGESDFLSQTNQNSGTITYNTSQTAAIASGSKCVAVYVGTAAGQVMREWDLGSATDVVYLRQYIYLPSSGIPGNNIFPFGVFSTTTGALRLSLSSTRRLRLSVWSGDSFLTQSTDPIPLDTLVRLEAKLDLTAGTVSYRAYDGHSTTPIANCEINDYAVTYAISTVDRARFGSMQAGPTNYTYYSDAWAVSTTDWIGPVGASSGVTKQLITSTP